MMTTRLNRSACTALIVTAAATLAACQQGASNTYGGGQPAPQPYPTQTYPQGGYQQASAFGSVTNVEFVPAGSSGNTQGVVGAVAGGAIGGLVGNQVGGGSGRKVATVAGVVGGALIGQAIERNMSAQNNTSAFYRVTVRFDDGSTRQFNYAQAPNVHVGDRVRAEGNQLYR